MKSSYFLPVATGAFTFLADLVRNIAFPLQVDFVRVQSYGFVQSHQDFRRGHHQHRLYNRPEGQAYYCGMLQYPISFLPCHNVLALSFLGSVRKGYKQIYMLQRSAI
jgi:hypothetical protein